MRTSAALLVTALFIPAVPACAQEKSAAANDVYKVEFLIHDESDAASKAGRRYTILVEGNERGQFRVGQKVPYITGSFQPGASVNPMVATQYNYADVGVNIDCRVNELDGRIRLRSSLELSSILPRDKNASPAPPSPSIGQLKVDVNALVDPGKPTVVASIDDPVTSRHFDVAATVTKVR